MAAFIPNVWKMCHCLLRFYCCVTNEKTVWVKQHLDDRVHIHYCKIEYYPKLRGRKENNFEMKKTSGASLDAEYSNKRREVFDKCFIIPLSGRKKNTCACFQSKKHGRDVNSINICFIDFRKNGVLFKQTPGMRNFRHFWRLWPTLLHGYKPGSRS